MAESIKVGDIMDTEVPIGSHVIDGDDQIFTVHEGDGSTDCTHCTMDGFTCMDLPCARGERTDEKDIYYKAIEIPKKTNDTMIKAWTILANAGRIKTCDSLSKAARSCMEKVSINGVDIPIVPGSFKFEFNHAPKITCHELHVQRLTFWVKGYNESHDDKIIKIGTPKGERPTIRARVVMQSGVVHNIKHEGEIFTWQSILKLLERIK